MHMRILNHGTGFTTEDSFRLTRGGFCRSRPCPPPLEISSPQTWIYVEPADLSSRRVAVRPFPPLTHPPPTRALGRQVLPEATEEVGAGPTSGKPLDKGSKTTLYILQRGGWREDAKISLAGIGSACRRTEVGLQSEVRYRTTETPRRISPRSAKARRSLPGLPVSAALSARS
jgi:hypothetical protein